MKTRNNGVFIRFRVPGGREEGVQGRSFIRTQVLRSSKKNERDSRRFTLGVISGGVCIEPFLIRESN